MAAASICKGILGAALFLATTLAQTLTVAGPAVGGGDDRPAIEYAFGQAMLGSYKTIQFPAGTFRVFPHSPQELLKMGYNDDSAGPRLSNILVQGVAGLTTILFEGFDPQFHDDGGTNGAWLAGFFFKRIDNLRVRDIEVRAVRPLATEGSLTSVTWAGASGGSRDWTIVTRVTDSAMFLTPSSTATFATKVLFPVFGPASPHAGRVVRGGIIFFNSSIPVIVSRSVVATGAVQHVTIVLNDLNNTSMRARLTTLDTAQEVSDDIVMCIAHQYHSNWAATGFRFVDCNDVMLDDCVAKSMHQGVSVENGCNVTAQSVTISPTSPTWMVGSMRNGFAGMYGVRGDLLFENCVIKGSFDEGFDLTGAMWSKVHTFTTSPPVLGLVSVIYGGSNVTQSHLDTGLRPGSWGCGSLEPKAALEVFNASFSLRGRAHIQSVVASTSPTTPWSVTLADSLPAGTAVGDLVVLLGNVFSSATVANCTFTGGKGAGVMIAGPNVTVHGCTFTNLDGPAIRATCIFDPSAMNASLNVIARPVNNVLIEGNQINRCNLGSYEQWPWDRLGHWRNALGAIDISVVTKSSGSDLLQRGASVVGNSGVLIRGNTINDTGRVGICVTASRLVAIVNNHISGTGLDLPGSSFNAHIFLENVDIVGVHDNDDPSYPSSEPGVVSSNVTGLKESGNIW